MTGDPDQSGAIAVYGATGFTGRLIAAELRRRSARFVLAARNLAKLEILAEDLGGDIPVRAVSLDDPVALRDLLEPCAAVIACAGPFQLHGEPVLAAAVEARAHYLDTTGEQPFMRRVFEDYGPGAERAGVALLTAMGFDYVPGDMIAALTAEGMGPLDEVTLAYAVSGFGPTRGTVLSGLGMIAGGDVEWRDGELVPASQSTGRGTWEFSQPVGTQRMVRYPAGEHLTVPRHVQTQRVRTLLTASTVLPLPLVTRVAPLVMAPFQLALRTPLRRALAALVPRLPEGPSESQPGAPTPSAAREPSPAPGSAEGRGERWEEIFSEDYLLTRPLLQAIAATEPVVLLIDEIDKTDQEFEAMLLEVLSDFQISIPELGVIEARTHPIVVLTSNNSRELTEALKRRCLYLWLDYPEIDRELEIVRLHSPEIDEQLARRLVEVVHMVRQLDLKKPPSIAESIDWARALLLLGADDVDASVFERTMSIIVKHRTDMDLVAERVGVKLGQPRFGAEAAG